MDFFQAKCVPLLFGKYKNQTIGKVAKTVKGMLYLHWLSNQEIRDLCLQEAINIFLTHPKVKKRLVDILADIY